MDETKGSQSATTLSRRSLFVAGAGAAASVAVGSALLGGATGAFAQDATPAASPEAALPSIPPEVEQFGHEWPVPHADLANTRNAVGSTIDASNISTLGVAWEVTSNATGGFGAITSQPIVQNGVAYLIDNAASMWAIDMADGTVKWRKEYNVATWGPNGMALGYGILIGVLGDAATVVALDPATGNEKWSFQLSNHNALGITMSPMIWDGLVIVSTEPGGNSKGIYEGGANGVVYALDILTGLTIWTWDTVVDGLWGNFRVNSGGGLWYPPAVDTETGILYMGIGNAGPFPGTEEFPAGSSRPGENDYANNLVALDPNAGKVLWNINVKPRDLFDLDNQESPILGTVQYDGADTPMVYSTGKHGFVIGVVRETGTEMWRRSVGTHKNDGLGHLGEEAVEVYPGVLGGVNAPMAWKDGVLYVAAWNFPTLYSATALDTAGLDYTKATTDLYALDGATGETIWTVNLPYGVTGAGPTISNDLLFLGSLDGIARAFSLSDGSQVWMSQTSAGINAPFAIAGDTLIVPAGSFIAPSADSPETLPGFLPNFIAYRLGATGTPTMGEAAATGGTPVAENTDTAVTVEAFDLGFRPGEVTIAANTDVSITLKNTGVLQHDFVIDNPKVDSGMVDGGTEKTFTVNLPAGEYRFYCSVEGHAASGMVGKLIAQ
ncbi:MAG: PQQ-binding-like beta-propeller repeat protein [Thermomicrobiales bacterium]